MMRQQKLLMALLALVLILGACKGESPTAPPSGGGGTTPPPTQTGFDVVLTASNATPLVDSTVIITATVTQNGQAVPNGTAVEFAVTEGAGFENTTNRTIIKTTVNGVATTSISASVAGPVTVSATVNNVTRTVTVNFQVRPTTPPPVSTVPSISAVTPAIGRPAGGEIIRITGTNFKAPVRVLFNLGGALPVEGSVVSVSPTLIEVVSPGINLGAGQQFVADIIVLTEAGTANEQRVVADDAFTYRNEQLTPTIVTATPNSGPVTGGTRVSIFGDGFQAPVQVLFGAAEARVITVDFSEIVVEAPAGRDTSDNGSGTVTGPVTITVRNIASATQGTMAAGFRYVAAIDITSINPHSGPATGGTDITIDGIGFLAPVEVTVSGQPATVLRVSGTQILVRTTPTASPCAPSGTGNVVVKNVANGDFEDYGGGGGDLGFTYIGVQPLIVSATPTGSVSASCPVLPCPGTTIAVAVRDPGVGPLGFADIRFDVVGRTIIPSPNQITTGSGTQTFSTALPNTGFNFPTVSCVPAGPGTTGTQLGPVEVPLSFNNLATSCPAATTILVNPPGPNPCVQTPPAATVTNPASGCANAGSVVAVGAATGSTTVTIRNTAATGAATLNITGVTSSNPVFTVTPANGTAAPGGSQNFNVTFSPGAAQTENGILTFSTNDPARPTIDVCVTGTGT